MARAPAPKTPEEEFLLPLAQLALRQPGIEALVFWGGEGWPPEPSEALESEEIAFWAEGLLPEGFALEWRIIAAPDGSTPDHIRLYAWEAGDPPPPEAGVLSSARWPL